MSSDSLVLACASWALQDMASEERKQADAKIVEDNLFKTLGAGEQEAETDAFQCGRCKQVRFLLRSLP